MAVGGATAAHALYTDCTEDQVKSSIARLTPEHVATFLTPMTVAAWRERPTTYLVTERDLAPSPTAQRSMSAQATWTVEIDSGHSPMYSHPDELARLLNAAIDRANAASP